MASRAVFMGSDSFSLPILRALLRDGHRLSTPLDVVAVVTQPDRPAGRGRKLVAGPVKQAAEEARISVLQPARLRRAEAVEELRAQQPDLIVVASYGQILPQSVLDMPRRGCLNLHPSLLPLYRGPSPIVGPLLNGDPVTGISVMVMGIEMDAGPLIAQQQVPIDPNETAGELQERLAIASADLLLETLPTWMTGQLVPTPQDETRATYTSKVSKEDGLVDWALPAPLLERRVRAYNPWPVAYTLWEGTTLKLHRARAVEGSAPIGQVDGFDNGAVRIGTGEGILLVTELQLSGARVMDAQTFARGRRDFLDAHLG